MEPIAQLPEVFDSSRDLVKRSKDHISFLQGLHRHGITLQRPSLKSLERYTDFWLPFLHKYQSEELVPPADIAWLWHCHRLAPHRYLACIRAKFGPNTPTLEANPPFAFQLDATTGCIPSSPSSAGKQELLNKTMNLWKQEYPNESFFLNLEEDIEDEEKEEKKETLVNDFDLLGSTDRQATFLWQVSGPCFSDDSFLQEGLANYYKFLKLRNHTTKQITIVPTYQIDLFWHTHILSNIAGYYTDCKILMGATLNHDDSLNDRTEDGPLDTAFKATKAAWKEAYGEDYNVEGGMYRGEPPGHYYSPSWEASASQIKTCGFETPIGPFLHAIGNHGSSSTNPGKLSSRSPYGTAWTPLDGVAPDGKPAFVAAGTSQGIKAHPFKSSYVFGRKDRDGNLGYYHVTTKEAYDILAMRVSDKIWGARCKIDCATCCSLGLCAMGTWMKQMKKDLEDLQDLEAILKARAAEDVPTGNLHLPSHVASNPTLRSKHITSDGKWLFPTFYYASAGGCGAATVRRILDYFTLVRSKM